MPQNLAPCSNLAPQDWQKKMDDVRVRLGTLDFVLVAGSGLVGTEEVEVSPRLNSRNRVARNRAKKTSMSEPKTAAAAGSPAVVVLVRTFVMATGLGVDVVV